MLAWVKPRGCGATFVSPYLPPRARPNPPSPMRLFLTMIMIVIRIYIPGEPWEPWIIRWLPDGYPWVIRWLPVGYPWIAKGSHVGSRLRWARTLLTHGKPTRTQCDYVATIVQPLVACFYA